MLIFLGGSEVEVIIAGSVSNISCSRSCEIKLVTLLVLMELLTLLSFL